MKQYKFPIVMLSLFIMTTCSMLLTLEVGNSFWIKTVMIFFTIICMSMSLSNFEKLNSLIEKAKSKMFKIERNELKRRKNQEQN